MRESLLDCGADLAFFFCRFDYAKIGESHVEALYFKNSRIIEVDAYLTAFWCWLVKLAKARIVPYPVICLLTPLSAKCELFDRDMS